MAFTAEEITFSSYGKNASEQKLGVREAGD